MRVSSKNVSAQFIKPTTEGDQVLSSAHSRNLKKLGWKGSSKSVPACYLLGLLAGKRAKEKGVEKAYLYNGLSLFVNGSRVSALVKGVKDAGVDVPMSDEAAPSAGQHQREGDGRVRKVAPGREQGEVLEVVLGAPSSGLQAGGVRRERQRA